MSLSEDDKRFIVHALGAHAALTSVAAGGDLSAVVEYISRATGEVKGGFEATLRARITELEILMRTLTSWKPCECRGCAKARNSACS